MLLGMSFTFTKINIGGSNYTCGTPLVTLLHFYFFSLLPLVLFPFHQDSFSFTHSILHRSPPMIFSFYINFLCRTLPNALCKSNYMEAAQPSPSSVMSTILQYSSHMISLLEKHIVCPLLSYSFPCIPSIVLVTFLFT